MCDEAVSISAEYAGNVLLFAPQSSREQSTERNIGSGSITTVAGSASDHKRIQRLQINALILKHSVPHDAATCERCKVIREIASIDFGIGSGIPDIIVKRIEERIDATSATN